jgi:hypothetical protein
MLLKRIHDHSSGAPVVIGVKVLRAGRKQKFTPQLIERGIMEGWLALGGGRITLTGHDGAQHVWRIVRSPGRYCCHCGERLGDNADNMELARLAQAHVAAKHAGVASPDPENPSGYLCTHAYKGVREQPAAPTPGGE